MFKSSAEKRVLRDADKIVSLKEDMDALSWNRVLELGKRLQEDEVAAGERVECARELVTIAQSNLSLSIRLGIDPDPSPSHIMASGVEVIEGGMAEAALGERESRVVARESVAEDEEPLAEALEEASKYLEFPTVAMPPLSESVFFGLAKPDEPDEHDFEEAADAVLDPVLPEPTVKGVEVPVDLAALLSSLPPMEETKAEVQCVPEAEPEPEPQPEPEPEPEPTAAQETERLAKKKSPFARFRNLYQSRDGNLCVFEDEHGHLVAVDASKLA